MIHYQSSGFENITPEQATTWLENYKYQGQRKPTRARIALLASEMDKGRFTVNTITVAHCNGQSFLVNGQHTLHAIVACGRPIGNLTAHFTADSMEDVNNFYTTLDINLTRGNSVRYKALELHAKLGVSASVLAKIASAVSLVSNGFDLTTPASVYDTADLMLAWKDSLLTLLECLNSAGQELAVKLVRRDILSVAVATWHYCDDRTKVKDFWGGVATGVGLLENDPRKYLRDFAIRSLVGGGAAMRKSQSTATGYGIRYTANCWKYWYLGVWPKVMKVHTSSPIIIPGTPFK